MTDSSFEKHLKEHLRTVLPNVYDLVYSGDDVPKYLVYSYYSRGRLFANGKPTAKTWAVNVTLWAKKGIGVYKDREKLVETIVKMGGTYPTCETAVVDEWKQFVYEFEVAGGVD